MDKYTQQTPPNSSKHIHFPVPNTRTRKEISLMKEIREHETHRNSINNNNCNEVVQADLNYNLICITSTAFLSKRSSCGIQWVTGARAPMRKTNHKPLARRSRCWSSFFRPLIYKPKAISEKGRNQTLGRVKGGGENESRSSF